jgi:cell division septation protein DedD
MAEIRRGFGDEQNAGERLPWLQPVEPEEDYDGPERPAGRGLLWLGVALVLVAGVALGALWLTHRRQTSADVGTVIHAPPGPYKIKAPVNAQDNDGVDAARAGTGTDIDSPLDLAAVPEEPIAHGRAAAPAQARSQPAAAPITAGAPAPAPKAVAPPAPAAPKAPPAPSTPPMASAPNSPPSPGSSGGDVVQLGAFSTEAKAKTAWKTLSARFSYLAPMTPVVSPVESSGATLYRLRASGGGPAARICAQLRVAGETCAVAN